MGNCANKPLTTDEREAPEVAVEDKTPSKVEEISSREIDIDQNNNKDEGKKPEAEPAAKPTEVKPSQSAKFEDVVALAVDTNKGEAPKPTAEPPKPAAEPPKPTAEPPKPAAEPPKPTVEPPKSATEPPKPAAVEPKKEEVKPVVVAPATAPTVVEEKKPVSK